MAQRSGRAAALCAHHPFPDTLELWIEFRADGLTASDGITPVRQGKGCDIQIVVARQNSEHAGQQDRIKFGAGTYSLAVCGHPRPDSAWQC
jgi:hypothetical protein